MTTEKSAADFLVEKFAQSLYCTVMPGPKFWLPMVKMSWQKNSDKRNLCC